MTSTVATSEASRIRIGQILALTDAFPHAIAARLALFAMLADTMDMRRFIRGASTLLQSIVSCSYTGFFWSAPNGAMQDYFTDCEAYMRGDAVGPFQEFIAAGNWLTFDDNVLRGPVVGALIPYQTETWTESDVYKVAHGTQDLRHLLDAVVHDGVTPKGCFLFLRTNDEPPYAPHELEAARILAQLTLSNFELGRPEPNSAGSRMMAVGRVLTDAECNVGFRNLEALLTIRLLSGATNLPIFEAWPDYFRRACKAGVDRAVSQGSHSQHVANPWGEFVTEYENVGDGQVIVSFLQSMPWECHLARTLAAHPLTARRAIIAWLLAQSLPRKSIAWLCGLSEDTVDDHVTGIFAQIGVRNVKEFSLRLAQ